MLLQNNGTNFVAQLESRTNISEVKKRKQIQWDKDKLREILESKDKHFTFRH